MTLFRVVNLPAGLRAWTLDLGICQIRWHRWTASDQPPDIHDENRPFVSLVLWGTLTERRYHITPTLTPDSHVMHRCLAGGRDGGTLSHATAQHLTTHIRHAPTFYRMPTGAWHTVTATPGAATLSIRGPIRRRHARFLRPVPRGDAPGQPDHDQPVTTGRNPHEAQHPLEHPLGPHDHGLTPTPTNQQEETVKHRIIAVALAVGIIAATATAVAAIEPASSTHQHFYVTIHTDRAGQAVVNLQVPVDPADVVVKVASGGTNLGGEDPSFATVNFGGHVNTDEDAAYEAIRVRVIGWHANVVTGQAEFRYYGNKDTRIAVDVYERTTPPPPTP